MEDMPYMFLIPAFFLAVCVTFILINKCCARRKLKQNDKIAHPVSFIDINNLASHPSKHHHHHSSGHKHKLKSGLQKLKSLHSHTNKLPPTPPVKSEKTTPSRSTVILMNECRRDLPPSYGSLYERPSNVTQTKNSNDSTSRFMNLICLRPFPPVHSSVSSSIIHL